MKWIFKTVVVFMVSFFFTIHSFASKYELEIDKTSPATGSIHLFLETALDADTKFITRQLNKSNIENPVCANLSKIIERQDDGWLAPVGCTQITWRTKFSNASGTSHDVSKQENLHYLGRWWLFSEWGNLLRPVSDKTESEICTKGIVKICRHVPTTEEAPLLILIGTPNNRIIIGSTSFNFFTGNLPDNFNVQHLYSSYDRQLSYLSSVIEKVNNSSPPKNIDVLVLGISASLDEVGGAAGADSYLANIAVTKQGTSLSEQVKHLWIGAHEMAHMLGLGTNALWASESLAHYYGFKSFGKNKQASQLFEEMTEKMGRIGLLKANQLVMQGEGEHYAQFYVKGAAFWKDLDEEIHKATQFKKTLDDYLLLLINGQFDVSGELPAEFLKVMSEVIGKDKLDQLVDKYL